MKTSYCRLVGLSAGLLLVSALQGCAKANLTDVPYSPDPRSVNAMEIMRDVSIEARNELRLLAQAKEAKTRASMTADQQAQKHFQALHVPQGFEERKTFFFQGKSNEAAKALAMLAAYEVQFIGKPIVNEPIVYIDVRNKPIMEALRELGMQTGSQIRVEIYEEERLMRYVYAQQ